MSYSRSQNDTKEPTEQIDIAITTNNNIPLDKNVISC